MRQSPKSLIYNKFQHVNACPVVTSNIWTGARLPGKGQGKRNTSWKPTV